MFSALLSLSLLSPQPALAAGYPAAAYVDLAAGGTRLLRAPAPRDCRALLGAADAGITGARGMDADAVRAAMAEFHPNLYQCAPPERAASGTLELSITVGCDGQVGAVEVLSDGALPAALVTCVQEILTLAPLPASGLPEGETFLYPIRFDWPG